MKHFLNTAIFLCFFLLFLFGDILLTIQSENVLPDLDESLWISYQNLLEKYKKINEYLEMQTEEPEKRISSKIIFRDPLEFFEVITIAKGENENIFENAAVITKEGLLGIVISTTNHSSKVRLLTNEFTSLSVKIKDTYGVLESNEKKECWVKNLTKETEIEIGDEIFTSGLTEVVGNILVGTVEEIEKDSLGLIQSVKVKPSADLNQIYYVTIIQKEMAS